MSDVVIHVENLSKKYLLRHTNGRSSGDGLRHVLQDTLSAPFRKLLKNSGNPDSQTSQSTIEEEFWALKDVSFEVKRGEVVGIIGRNGAGKSTLLKILSRITEPTKGRIGIKGRIASLLEVGTGFHPELTGRENIYLNGAILGMSRAEVKSKFDEIVNFSGIEKFLDTPVKRYSSGMYVRLAFSVAAHLEPEILVVDEVLAVGDAEFQRKCLGKMKDVATGGRTVLFVSHQMQAMRQLCDIGIFLQVGKIMQKGFIHACVDQYIGNALTSQYDVVFEKKDDKPCITRITVNPEQASRGDLDVTIDYESPYSSFFPVPGLVLTSSTGDPVYGSNLRMHPGAGRLTGGTSGRIKFWCGKMPLMPGRYKVSVWLGEWHQDHDAKIDALQFFFKMDQTLLSAPPVSAIGYIDVKPEWTAHPV